MNYLVGSRWCSIFLAPLDQIVDQRFYPRMEEHWQCLFCRWKRPLIAGGSLGLYCVKPIIKRLFSHNIVQLISGYRGNARNLVCGFGAPFIPNPLGDRGDMLGRQEWHSDDKSDTRMTRVTLRRQEWHSDDRSDRICHLCRLSQLFVP